VGAANRRGAATASQPGLGGLGCASVLIQFKLISGITRRDEQAVCVSEHSAAQM